MGVTPRRGTLLQIGRRGGCSCVFALKRLDDCRMSGTLEERLCSSRACLEGRLAPTGSRAPS
jgi:hypothetical protein